MRLLAPVCRIEEKFGELSISALPISSAAMGNLLSRKPLPVQVPAGGLYGGSPLSSGSKRLSL